jgi:hypothetical protein
VIEGARPGQGILTVTLITVFAVSSCHVIGIFSIVIIFFVTGKAICRQQLISLSGAALMTPVAINRSVHAHQWKSCFSVDGSHIGN